MMNKFPTLVGGLLVLVLCGCEKQSTGDPAAKGNAKAEAAAIESARTWLALVDGGNYGQNWDEAAALFKSAVTKTGWEEAVRAVRTPLGKLNSRKLRSQQYATSLPGAPNGEYVVIQYDTDFVNKANAVESITPLLDKDGKWRVSGYYIK